MGSFFWAAQLDAAAGHLAHLCHEVPFVVADRVVGTRHCCLRARGVDATTASPIEISSTPGANFDDLACVVAADDVWQREVDGMRPFSSTQIDSID
ncbi:MAG: hypothetical protein ABIQ73_07015 [Acidimicrobiales bacterium]